jgi:threonine dehydrogenase-like Zn-dependent dehydrogenase
MKNTLLIIALGITAYAPTPHPISAQPAIVDSKAVVRFCLDYMRRAVPASGLAEAIAAAGPSKAGRNDCKASRSGTVLDPLLLTGRAVTAGSISVGSRTDFKAMNRAIEMHRLRPVMDRTFPFAEAKEAYRHFEGRGHFGKVVITQD